MRRLNLPWPRRRRRTGLTLVLWAPHPAQGDFHRALRTIAKTMKSGPLLHSERAIGRLTSDKLRELVAAADRQQRPLIVEAGLLPETKLVPFTKSAVREVRQVLTRVDASRVHIVVLCAPQDRLIETVYARRAENGIAGSFEEHLAEYADVDLSYAPLVRELSALAAVAAVAPLDWSTAEKRLATPLSRVLELAAGQVPADLLKRFDRPAKVRGVASRRGVRVAKAMHDFVETDKERGLVRSMVRENFPARRLNDVNYLSDEDRKKLRARYRDDRRALKTTEAS